MASLNSVTISGNATRDVEIKSTTSGTNVANITIAVSGYKDDTSFIDCVAFGKTAEIAAQYVTRGGKVGVTGRLQQRSYEDKNGNKRSSVEIVVDNLVLLGSKQDSAPVDVAPIDIGEEPIDISALNIPF